MGSPASLKLDLSRAATATANPPASSPAAAFPGGGGGDLASGVTEAVANATVEQVESFTNYVKMNGPDLEAFHCVLA
jgi:hypothetical protein